MQINTQDGQFNIGYHCSKYQCEIGKGSKVALKWLSPDHTSSEFSFFDLEQKSNQISNILTRLDFGEGSKIVLFLPKQPLQFFTFIAILKIQAIACILFPTFGYDALLDRIKDAKADCIITTSSLLRKIQKIQPKIPSLKTILLVDIEEHQTPEILSLPLLIKSASEQFSIKLTSPITPSVLHYTSGSTGKPKGALHVHQSIVSQNKTFHEVFQPRHDDVYWCTADLAWVTGVSYGIVGPWSAGITQVQYGGNYGAETWLNILEKEHVNIWYTAPTALRMLRQEEPELFNKYNLPSLRYIFSVGEPLNPEIVEWSRKTLGKEIYDTFFQTETGSIMVSNRPGIPIKLGSMGKPVEGIHVEILSDAGKTLPFRQPGQLCFEPGWPAMMQTYLNNDTGFKKKLEYGYFHTGDNAYRDEDGYIWFLGRSDDLIKTGGHLISPFEIESSLLEIEEIAEAGVIGIPDEMLYEKVVAFIKLKKNKTWNKELEIDTILRVSNRVSPFAAPRVFHVVDQIPKNKSGKIMRRLLKAQLLGLDQGDISTMEEQ